VAGPIGDPLPRRIDADCHVRVVVPAKRAGDGHEAIAMGLAAVRGCSPAQAPGDGECRHIPRQWLCMLQIAGVSDAFTSAPVVIEHGTVAQIGNAGTSELAEPCKGHRVWARAEQHVDTVATALQRRAVVRRAEKDERAQEAHPSVSGPLRRCTCAADDEPAHAVSDEDQVAQRHGPRLDQPLEQRRELRAVGRDVAPAVVTQVHGIGVQVTRQALSVIVLLSIPHRIAHAEPVHHDHDALARLR